MNTNTSQWSLSKSEMSTTGGMVVAKQELAALAGIQALKDGGNAVDAAVTTAFAMTVLEPYQNGIGGGGYLVYRPAIGKPAVVEFVGRAPQAATTEALQSRTTLAFSGPLAAAVPGSVAGLASALEKYGTFPLSRAIEPAIKLANDGFPIDFMLALQIAKSLQGLRNNPDSARTFLIDGDPGIAHGQTVLRQPELARTFASIAEEGPQSFYEGEIANQIVSAIRDRGGILSTDDFASYRPEIMQPLSCRFNGNTVLTVPPPSPGLTTLEALRLLDGFDLQSLGHNSAASLHLLAEAFKQAFADRDAYLGDPDFSDIPTETLLSNGYIDERRAEINPEVARTTVQPGTLEAPASGAAGKGGGTTHLCVVDAEGNAVSLTQTLIGGLTGFGVAGNSGVLMNCSLQWFDPQPGAPNSVGPGKRPLTNMTPIIVERNDRPVLLAGAPGSRRITNAVSQVALNVLTYGMTAQQAVSAPRIDLSTGILVADDRIDPHVIVELRRIGHEVDVVHEFINAGGPSIGLPGLTGYFARPNAIYIDEEGTRHGGDYPYSFGVSAITD